MTTLGNILFYTFVGSFLSLAGGVVLASRQDLAGKIGHLMTPFAAGAFLGAAFFDLLPEASELAGGIDIFAWVFIGIMIFFLLERFIHWFDHHQAVEHNHQDSDATIPLIVLGDTVHNLIDGMVIAISFLANPAIGVVSAIAVAAHELPQEMGDFGVMLSKGLSRNKVLGYNILTALAAFAGALITYWSRDMIAGVLPILLAVTSGFFIYIALSDLVPDIHHKSREKMAALETILLFLGAGFVWLAIRLLEG